MSFVNQYRSTTIYGQLKVQKYNTGNIAGLLDISGNTILQGSCRVDGNIFSNDGTVDISGNLAVSGSIAGTFVANNSTITLDGTDATFFPTFVSATTGNLPLKADASFNYNPFSNILTVPNINGTCNNATLATNSTNVTISTDATNANFFPTFVSGTTGNLGIKTDADYKYNPFSNTLNLNNLVVNGTITGAGAVSNPTITLATSGTYYPTFVPTTSGTASTLNVDSSLFIDASTNKLTADNVYLSNTSNQVIDSLIIKARADSNYTLNSNTLQFGSGSGLTCNFSNMVISF